MLKKIIFFTFLILNFFNMKQLIAESNFEAVGNFDINKYAGTWYEVARLNHTFQKNCDYVVANYILKNEDKIEVINTCTLNTGKLKTAKGVAKFATEDTTLAHLKVSFFWPFYGNYKVIMLDPKYNWAVVGDGTLRYFWILSRTPSISKDLLEVILKESKDLGFDINNLIYSSTQEYKPEVIEENN
jgi:apolipoprotein D and lipocalin family protein